MRAIFISYRREDAEGHAGRLFEDLVQRFGSASVFMDVADIEPGRDFRRVIEQQVASCGVLLAVIGKSWLDVTDAQGQRRLDAPNDFVVLETAAALKRDIPLIPVLVHGATMPRADQLPDALKDLAYRNSVELTHARWSSDVQLLIRALLPYVDAAGSEARAIAAPTPAPVPSAAAAPPARRSGLSPAVLGGVVALGAAAGVGYLWWDHARAPAPIAAADAPASGTVAMAATTPSAPAPAPEASRPSASSDGAKATPTLAEAPTTAPPSAPAPRKRVPAPASASAPAPRPVELPPVATAPAAPVPAAAPTLPPPSAAPATATPAPDTQADADMAVPSRADPALAIYGERVKGSYATRTIVITPSTNYVNVTGGEIVRFTVGNKSMAWNFNGRSGSFDLARAAPALIDHKVIAYIAPNPYYPRSGG